MVRRLLIEEGAQIVKEFYVGMVVDRASQRVALLASSEGGMEIEEVAKHSPEKIHTVRIDPTTGLTEAKPRKSRAKSASPMWQMPKRSKCLQGLYRAFVEKDAMLAEINPLIVTAR